MTDSQTQDDSSAAGAPAAPPAKPQTFYRYEDASGRLIIVDSADKLPEEARPKAQALELQSGGEPAAHAWDRANLTRLHWPSLCYGFAAAGVLFILFRLARGQRRLVKALVFLTFIALGAGLYFGFLRRLTGEGSELLSSPTQILDDAKRQVEAVKKRQRERDIVLDEIKRESK